MKRIAEFLREDSGQDTIEYTLLVAFVALGSASIYLATGGSMNVIWTAGSNTLVTAVASAS